MSTIIDTAAAKFAADLRTAAAEAKTSAAESFDRCDTDGFLSQWAFGVTAQRLSAEADLAENGGFFEYPALFDLDGNVASTHLGHGQYGSYWVLNDEAAERYGKRFFSPSKANDPAKADARDRAKGFTTGAVKVRGYVKVDGGGGRGLGGTLSVRVVTLPFVSDLREGNFEVVTTDRAGSDA